MIGDARLLPPAAAAWLAAILLQFIPWWSWARSVQIAALLALLGAIVGLLLATSKQMPSWRGVLVVSTIAFGASGLTAFMHVSGLRSEPVHSWADTRVSAEIQGVVTSPVSKRTFTGAAIWQDSVIYEVRIAASQVSARGERWSIDVPIVVRLEEPDDAPAPGSEVMWSGRLIESGDPNSVAAGFVARGPPRLLEAPGVIDGTANAMRAGLTTSLEGLPPDGAALVAGLAVGDKALQTEQLADQMRRSGLSHLTAVSGGNTAIVCGIVLAVAAFVGLPLMARAALAGIVLAYYVVLVGPEPSVLRAAVMGGVMLIALVVGGRRAGPSVLGFAVILLVMVAPSLALAWGFALSVVATAGLIMLAPLIDDRLAVSPLTGAWPRGLRTALAVTIAAQISTLPILVLMGGAVGWVAVPANLAAMPAVGPVTVLGLAVAVIAPVLPQIASLLAHLAIVPAEWIAFVARTTANWPAASLPLPSGWMGVGLLTAIVVISFVARRLLRRRYPWGTPRHVHLIAVTVVLAAAAVFVTTRHVLRDWPPPGWIAIACSVGQGDGLLLRTGVNSVVVVDVGPDDSLIRRCLDDAEVQRIDAIVLTHFHADHVSGLAGVLDAYAVPLIGVGPLPEPLAEFDEVLRLASAHDVPVDVIQAGEIRQVGNMRWRAIWPRRIIRVDSVPNNASVVLVADIAGRDILLCGDIEPPAQAAIEPDLRGLDLDVVKVPHHGSRFQHPQLPSWTHPSIALVSVGLDNPYGHPSDATIGAWKSAGADVGRTDTEGDLAVVAQTANGVSLVRRGR